MNLPELNCYGDQAVDIVVSVINKAKEAVGEQLTLKELANSRNLLTTHTKVNLTSLKCPLALTSENLIRHAIERKWKLTKTFLYALNYLENSNDESSRYFYFEAIFSQPTLAYPMPQTAVSVFFRVEDKNIEPPKIGNVPKVTFRIEGHHQDHDIRHVLLTRHRLLGVLMMKKKFYMRIENIGIF